jgi:hypothetical protein
LACHQHRALLTSANCRFDKLLIAGTATPPVLANVRFAPMAAIQGKLIFNPQRTFREANAQAVYQGCGLGLGSKPSASIAKCAAIRALDCGDKSTKWQSLDLMIQIYNYIIMAQRGFVK